MNIQALDQFERFCRYAETERRLSPHTLSAYRLDLEVLIAYCDRACIPTWARLEPAHVRAFAAAAHAHGLSAASIQRRLSAVRSFLRFLEIREHAITRNPAETIQGPKLAPRLPKVLDADQMALLLAIKGDDPLSVRDRAIMELLYSSALRLAELVRLNCDDLDLADRTVRVLGKGSVGRVVPIGSHAVTAIRAWLRVRSRLASDRDPALFVGRNGKRIGRRNVELRIAAHARRQRIGVHVHPHMFRHSAATHVFESSNDIRAVQEFLGHASISTTQIYTHLDFAHVARAYDAAHPRSKIDPEQRARMLPPEALPAPKPRAEVLAESLRESPCDKCPYAARCSVEHLACSAFEAFFEGSDWRPVTRTDASAERYRRLDT
jgi:integrase/recombinase XerC